MGKAIRIGEQVVVCDREATVALYRDAINTAGADECRCLYCMNFAAQRGGHYPDDFLRLLGEIGADPLKELEAFNYDFEPGKSRSTYGISQLRAKQRSKAQNGQ